MEFACFQKLEGKFNFGWELYLIVAPKILVCNGEDAWMNGLTKVRGEQMLLRVNHHIRWWINPYHCIINEGIFLSLIAFLVWSYILWLHFLMLICFFLDVGLWYELCTINVLLNIHFCQLNVALGALLAIAQNLFQAFFTNSVSTLRRDSRLIYAIIISDHADWTIERHALHL